MDFHGPQDYLIALALIVIVSYFFNILSKLTRIPSVLMLISTGVGITYALKSFGGPAVEEASLRPILEILGTVGIIMIVLEAALDLELTRDKRHLIWSSLALSVAELVTVTALISALIHYSMDAPWSSSLIYAIPLSILSSAIVIPSVGGLGHHKKEFMIYQSTFSDILGIMIFYFTIEAVEAETAWDVAKTFSWSFLFSMVISVILSYLLVFILQNIKSQVKLFLLIAVLILLYAVGKRLHLSPLLIILIFGLILNNSKLFFQGRLAKWLKFSIMKTLLKDFRLITLESSFVIRTFFFVVFGITIHLPSLMSPFVFIFSTVALLGMYVLRDLWMNVFVGRDNKPELYIAPRGLITILLFFNIPESHAISNFENGILLYIIIATSIVMTWSLIAYEPKGESKKEKKSTSATTE
ncbi:MAG: cation:proton antiporter [Flavobacteriia bacterium]|nr:cation:proton antiporter [Flavobacteriia bacterium]